MPVLEVRDPTKRFGGRVACDGVSFTVAPGGDRRAARPERRRQDHLHPHGVGLTAPAAGVAGIATELAVLAALAVAVLGAGAALLRCRLL